MKRIFILLTSVGIFLCNCHKSSPEFLPIDYFPIAEGNYWQFNGTIKDISVNQVSRENGLNKAELTYKDSLGTALWKESYRLQSGQLYWEALIPLIPLMPMVQFDPPIPMAPFSQKLWAKENISTTEIQSTTVVTSSKLHVTYEIDSIEDVVVPAGPFFDCIKLKVTFEYRTTNEQPFFLGDYYWWFAKDFGPVKYDFPVESGELLKCNIIKERLVTHPPTLSR